MGLIIFWIMVRFLPSIITFSIISAIFVKMIRSRWMFLSTWKRLNIPGPQPNFFFGNMVQMRVGIQKFQIDNAKKYGSIYGTYYVNKANLNISDPEVLKEVLVKDFDNFINRNMDVGFEGIQSHMLLVLKGERWKDVRRAITPTFTTMKIKAMFPIVDSCVTTAESLIESRIENSDGRFGALEYVDESRRTTFDLVA
ncbi:hypothetical protein AB6A40_007244 [Gnathostoma spinigerum]|uniref:Cytochrome P450 n=1 Tax=Gnathostoma spinigerum TaxID=75299 RepID=A0ABD6EWA7_9BILA